MTEKEHEDFEKALREVIKTPSGKRVMFWVLEQSSIYRDAFSGDDAATNYVLGQQSTGRKLIEALDRLDPRTYPRLLLDVADLKAMDLAAAAPKNDEIEDDEYAD